MPVFSRVKKSRKTTMGHVAVSFCYVGPDHGGPRMAFRVGLHQPMGMESY